MLGLLVVAIHRAEGNREEYLRSPSSTRLRVMLSNRTILNNEVNFQSYHWPSENTIRTKANQIILMVTGYHWVYC